MNKREIILDFTSLLDVVMLILFFFVLFSTFETNEMQAEIAEQKELLTKQQTELEAEYDQLNADVQIKLNEAEKVSEQASEFLYEARLADERAAENVEGINDFIFGNQLKIELQMNNDDWTLVLHFNDESKHNISHTTISNMATELINILSEMDYTIDDTILCEFVYDATEGGTASAYRESHKLFEQIKKKYRHFFFSETDISIFKEE